MGFENPMDFFLATKDIKSEAINRFVSSFILENKIFDFRKKM